MAIRLTTSDRIRLEGKRIVSERAKRANEARNKKLSKRRRREIAVVAATARWSKPRGIKKSK